MNEETKQRNFVSEVEKALFKEYLSLSKGASIAITAVALFYFVDGLELKQYLGLIRFLCGAVFVVQALRFTIAVKSFKAQNFDNLRVIFISKVLALVSGVTWGSIFTFALVETAPSAPVNILLLATMTAFSFSIAMTLSVLGSFVYSLFLMLPFVVVNLMRFQHSGNREFLDIPFLMTLFLLYILYQTKVVRKNLRTRIENEIKLKYAIEDLKVSQDQLMEQTRKTVYASRLSSLGEMASGVAHEINNPLTIIKGCVEQIERALGKPDSIDADFLNLRLLPIIASVQRIAKIVKGLRYFSQQSDGEKKRPALLMQIIDGAFELCAEKFRSHGIAISISGDLNLWIACRSVQISQILVHLLHNAYDQILAKNLKKEISIRCFLDNDKVKICISNFGNPISEEVRAKLFFPFFTTKEVGMGTGLGLSTSKGIAQEHGGNLALVDWSETTTFELILLRYAFTATDGSPEGP